jgi:hypothetical protein
MVEIAHVDKPQISIKTILDKITNLVVLNIGRQIVVINNHMDVIDVQIGKNTMEDAFLDGGSWVNIIIE